jgi:hypothetical protein
MDFRGYAYITVHCDFYSQQACKLLTVFDNFELETMKGQGSIVVARRNNACHDQSRMAGNQSGSII